MWARPPACLQGYNGYGQLGDGGATARSRPTAVLASGKLFKLVAIGDSHTCGISTDSRMFCFVREAGVMLAASGR